MTRDQFAAQWEASREKLYRFAYCYVKNEPDAMELLSEATFRAFCSLDTLRDPEAFDAWMYTILVRCAYGFLKQRNRFVPYEETREATEDSAEFSDSHFSPDHPCCLPRCSWHHDLRREPPGNRVYTSCRQR